MFELFGQFSMEVRQAFFGALGDAMKSGLREITPEQIAAALLRTPEVTELARRHDVSVSDLLAALQAAPEGEGTYDAFRQSIAESEKRPVQRASPAQERGISWLPGPSGHFASLPLSTEARHVLDRATASFKSSAYESITPLQLLRVVVASSPAVATAFSQHGLSPELL